ncbi:allantoicase [Actinomadura craniellae]|uniref:Probable allantoicase n=1 Tax=Actinomadura craniellae TaxID=2231787 RepID=A0A365H272_9ACTN|nr:allantoicase [Actinomadura craniellae]RAY13205.1 allantoicase [Actinomadura craniellae]
MTDFTRLPDLAVRPLGGSVVAASDEFFAEKENLINPDPPVFVPRTFGAKGQVYDGWETRRRREPGHDWAVVRLGLPGVIRGVVVDTAHFTGNFPAHAAVEACAADGYPTPEELTGWVEIVPRAPLSGDAAHAFPVTDGRRFTHVRLVIHPDGGVARLRVHGEVVPDPRLWAGLPIDLAALENGAVVADCSNRFYSSPANLISPGLARVMGEGWETARRRFTGAWGESNDWVTVRLAGAGTVRLAELDTTHFRGNAPGAAALRGLPPGADPADAGAWFALLPRTRLQPDTRHRFVLADPRPAEQVRLDVFPDGGMARLRLFGELAPAGLAAAERRWAETTGPYTV